MKHHKYIKIYILLLSILLLIGQVGILVHAEEHPFHDSHESCEVFVSAEQTDTALVINNIDLPVITHDTLDVYCINSNFPVSLRVYQARAPPFLS